MREIATVLGKLDDEVVDTEIPKDLVQFLVFEPVHRLTELFAEYNHHVEVQRRVPLLSSLPPSAYDRRPRRVALEEGH